MALCEDAVTHRQSQTTQEWIEDSKCCHTLYNNEFPFIKQMQNKRHEHNEQDEHGRKDESTYIYLLVDGFIHAQLVVAYGREPREIIGLQSKENQSRIAEHQCPTRLIVAQFGLCMMSKNDGYDNHLQARIGNTCQHIRNAHLDEWQTLQEGFVRQRFNLVRNQSK